MWITNRWPHAVDTDSVLTALTHFTSHLTAIVSLYSFTSLEQLLVAVTVGAESEIPCLGLMGSISICRYTMFPDLSLS